jgi:hypothetical protein
MDYFIFLSAYSAVLVGITEAYFVPVLDSYLGIGGMKTTYINLTLAYVNLFKPIEIAIFN